MEVVLRTKQNLFEMQPYLTTLKNWPCVVKTRALTEDPRATLKHANCTAHYFVTAYGPRMS